MTGDDRAARGHRTVPHTADLRIEAWAPTCEESIAEAVRGLAGSFAEIGPQVTPEPAAFRLTGQSAEDLLAAALDEVIYRMDADGMLPSAAVVRQLPGGGAELRLSLVPVEAAEITGAVPKAVSLSGLRCAQDRPGRWSAAVTIDV